MRQLRYGKIALFAAAALMLAASIAGATTTPNGAALQLRFFNDDPFSTLNTVVNYPAQIVFDDVKFPGATGFANLHMWKFSSDGGLNVHEFQNADNFHFCADLVITGDGHCEAGLNIAPWWFPGDGRINFRTTDGEIASFGGRMPFKSWTADNGLHYVKGEPLHIEMTYLAHSLSAADPGTFEYSFVYQGNTYHLGPIALDMGNPSEDPPHGLWGCLTPAFAGGFMQYFIGGSPDGGNAHCEWSNICFESLDPVPVESTTWGHIKSLY